MLNTKHEPRRHGDIFKCNDNPCMPLVSGLQNVGGRTLHARLLFNVFNIPNHCTLDSLTKVLCFLLKMTLFYLSNFISCQRDTYNKRKSRFVFFLEKRISLWCCAICYLNYRSYSYEHTVPSRAQPTLSIHL